MDKNTYKTPVVKVFITDDGVQYFFWCSFCNCFHRHGAVSAGHRIAHCNHLSNSPYLFDGYILKEYTKKELKELGLPTDYYEKRKKSNFYKTPKTMKIAFYLFAIFYFYIFYIV